MKQIGKQIRQLRRLFNITLIDAANEIGCSTSLLSEVENGKRTHVRSPVIRGNIEAYAAKLSDRFKEEYSGCIDTGRKEI